MKTYPAKKPWKSYFSRSKHPKGTLFSSFHKQLELEHLEGRVVPTTFFVNNTNDSGAGSLRQAIISSNADTNPDPDIINFAITGGTSPRIITLNTPLDVILNPITIDGYSQSGASPNTLATSVGNDANILIQLDGRNLAPGSAGLYLNGDNSTVLGLSLVNFPFGIYANGNNAHIQGNYFGVQADGSAQLGLSGIGVDVPDRNNAIIGGGQTPADQNIFGNLAIGALQLGGSNGVIAGNRVGLGKTNTSFMGNNNGIQINNAGVNPASNHTITNNLIGKNINGILLEGLNGGINAPVQNTLIQDNLIGTDAAKSTIDLGNLQNGIRLLDFVQNSAIGGAGPSVIFGANTIAFSGKNGILISGADSFGNEIKINSIYNNQGLGINLINGANKTALPPVIINQNNSGTLPVFDGYVQGDPLANYTVNFYSSQISDSPKQGENYLGTITITTDATGFGPFNGFTPTNNTSQLGKSFIVTATSFTATNGTSAFSAGPPVALQVNSGNNQSTMVTTDFAVPLTVKVVDQQGEPVPGIKVQFAPPVGGASATFPDATTSFVAISDSTGIATSAILTANSTPGKFLVLAKGNSGTVLPDASFSLANTTAANPAVRFTLNIPQGTQVFTGVPVTITLSAVDATGALVPTFTGKISLTTTDTQAIIPSTVTINAGDFGSVQFQATFQTPGPVTVFATNGTISGSAQGLVQDGSTGNFAVAPAQPSVAFPVGIQVSRVLATVKGIFANNVEDFVATVNWGDGTPSSRASIQPPAGGTGPYVVVGTHLYSVIKNFPITVVVARISDGTKDSAELVAVVLTPQQSDNLNTGTLVTVPPTQKLTETQVDGIRVRYAQPLPPPDPVELFVGVYNTNPQPYAPTLPAESFFDVRLSTPPPTAIVQLTFDFNLSYQDGTAPYVQFANDDSTSYQNVVSAFNQLVIINYVTGTISVFLDGSSFPTVGGLTSTVFTVVLGSSQASSNTVTILPAEFSGGMALSINYSSASTASSLIASSTTSTTLTFQNSRQTAIGLAPSTSNSSVLFRTSNYGGTNSPPEEEENPSFLTDPKFLSEVIRGTLGKMPEILGELLKKYFPTNPMEMLRNIPNSKPTQEEDPLLRQTGFEEDPDIFQFPSENDSYLEIPESLLEASWNPPALCQEMGNLDSLYQEDDAVGSNWGMFLMGPIAAAFLQDPAHSDRKSNRRIKACA